MIFDEREITAQGGLKAYLADPARRAEAHAALRRYLSQGLYSAQGEAIRPPLSNSLQGILGQGVTRGYISAAIAPGDVGGAAAGGEGHQDRPLTYWVPVPGVDQNWKQAFSRRPSASDGENYEGAVAIFLYKEIKLGDKPEFAIIQDTSAFVPNVTYGAAVNIYRRWIRDNKVWTVNNILEAGRRDALRYQAYLAYKALTDASWTTVTSPDTSWVKALNLGFANLKRAGLLDGGNTPLVYCSPEMAYIFAQIKHDQSSYLLTGNQLTNNFNFIDTQYWAAAQAPLMVMPGEAMWWQDREGPIQDSARDIFLDSDATTFQFSGNFEIMATKGKSATTGRIEATATLKQGVKLAVTS